MKYSYPVIIFIAAVISAMLAVYAWRRREKTAAAVFSWMMLAVAEWLLTSGFVTLSSTPEAAMLWIKARYTGLVFMVVLFVIYAIQYAGYGKWLTRLRTAPLFVIPVISTVITWTNEYHHLMIRSIQFYPDGPLLGLDAVTYGGWFWVHTIYSYLLVVVGVVLLARMALRSLHLYRGQSIALLVGIFPPLVSSVIDAFLLIPSLKHPIAPIGFAVMGMAFAYAMFQHHLINVVPVARDLLIENMRDSMLVVDGQNLIVDLNPAARVTLGLQAGQEVIGQHVTQVFRPWQDIIESYSFSDDTPIEIELDSSAGLRCYDLRIMPLLNQRGRRSGQMVVWRDITGRKHAEQQRLDLEMERERVNILQRFVNNASHDLRTPLTIIKTNLYLLQMASKPEKQQQYLSQLETQAVRLESLLEDLLSMPQLDQDDDYTFEVLDINTLMQEIVARQKQPAKAKNHRLKLESKPDIPPIRADRILLNRAITNIVVNAINYTPDGGSITLRTYLRGQAVVIEIQDTGIGIDVDHLPRIFERFYRVDEARGTEKGGTGLGLAISKRIVEAHQGQIEVESKPEKGSIFKISMPIDLETFE